MPQVFSTDKSGLYAHLLCGSELTLQQTGKANRNTCAANDGIVMRSSTATFTSTVYTTHLSVFRQMALATLSFALPVVEDK